VLNPYEYRELLRDALPQVVDADTISPGPRTLFTPASHRRALDPDVTIVQGGRGVGKTVWYKALQNDTLRSQAASEYQLDRLNRVDPLAGYGTELSPDKYPSQRTLTSLLQISVPPEDIWTAVILTALENTEIKVLENWNKRITWIQDNPEKVERSLASADREAQTRGAIKLFLFDALDRLSSNRRDADRLTDGILRVALALRTGTRNLRAKIFIRDDMFAGAQRNFPDASKLAASAANMTWSPVNLYALFFYQIGNSTHPNSAAFREETGSWKDGQERNVPPNDLTGDQERQKEVFAWIAGQHMGTDHRKGYTYTWLPNHLADGKGNVSPRSFLSALLTATNNTDGNFSTSKAALHWDAIRQGVQAASKIRVDEVKEDIPWIPTAIDPLRGLQVPIEQSEVIRQWEESGLQESLARLEEAQQAAEASDDQAKPSATGPLHNEYPELISELINLGVMSRRANGKLDLPDVYRIAFDLGRKGGVPRVR
jgi:hypothetical protein